MRFDSPHLFNIPMIESGITSRSGKDTVMGSRFLGEGWDLKVFEIKTD